MLCETEEDDVDLTSQDYIAKFRLKATDLLQTSLEDRPTALQNRTECVILHDLGQILDAYQEQAYLLDPFLEDIAKPFLAQLNRHLHSKNALLSGDRLQRTARLIYHFTKVRGQKIIARLFPNEVQDLSMLVAIFRNPETLKNVSWELRFVLLLWLSVACMLPFNLHNEQTFDDFITSDGQTQVQETFFATIERAGLLYVTYSGREREASAALLASLYTRNDSSVLSAFEKCEQALDQPQTSSSSVVGLLQMLCMVLQRVLPSSVFPAWESLLRINQTVDRIYESDQALVGKFRIKLLGRTAILGLQFTRAGSISFDIEDTLDTLLKALELKDTVVRWSAAKYLARLTELLESPLQIQVLEGVLESIHGARGVDLGVEHTWQGVCLAIAELARRGCVKEAPTSELLQVVFKALLFDRKRGVQSIGAGVRDASAYVIWALSRSLPKSCISSSAPELSNRLVCTALFDRELHVRRAASAAFQECVGRWGVFPDGIAILAQLDYVAVGVRRYSFLHTAPLISDYAQYQNAVIHHLTTVTIFHYDIEMRMLAAASLKIILGKVHTEKLLSLVSSQVPLLRIHDGIQKHGSLLILGSIAYAASAFSSEPWESLRSQIFGGLMEVASEFKKPRVDSSILMAALGCLRWSYISDEMTGDPRWKDILHCALVSDKEEVHVEAAMTLRAISSNSNGILPTFLQEVLSSGSKGKHAAAAKILGCVNYHRTSADEVERCLECLINCVAEGKGQKVSTYTVESRRNSTAAIASILCNEIQIRESTWHRCFHAILQGFEDYTVDQRGDVGSWVRLASVQSTSQIVKWTKMTGTPGRITQDELDLAVSSVLKQGLEQLDNLREVAGETWTDLIRLDSKLSGPLELRGGKYFDAILKIDSHSWRDRQWASMQLLPFLSVPEYKSKVLEGSLLSFGLGSNQSPLMIYVEKLPLHSEKEYGLAQLLSDLEVLLTAHYRANRFAVPIFTLIAAMLERKSGWELAQEPSSCATLCTILRMGGGGIQTLKSTLRLKAVVKLIIACVKHPTLLSQNVNLVMNLLSHNAPWVREEASEQLYETFAGSEEDDEVELQDILLTTGWSTEDFAGSLPRVRSLLSSVAKAGCS